MMLRPNFSDDFKLDAVAQITERGYLVAEVSQRLSVSPHSLYACERQFAQRPEDDAKDAEISRVKLELMRVTEERDILKNATAYFARDAQGDTRSLFSVRAMYRCLRIQPRDFYAWLKNPLSSRAKEDAWQTKLIRRA